MKSNNTNFYIKIKSLLDFLLSLIILLFSLPIFFSVFIILTISFRGNPFFLQKRPGKKGKVFNIIKFKTMNNNKDSEGHYLPDDKRLTKVGKIIRKLSIDEIPQLINVLKGDMSLVGPRPLLTEYLSLYNPFQKRRHEVKPGITGWAQINGRNAISWSKKFEYDVWYVDNISLLLDIKIIFLTIRKVIKKENISSVSSVTVEKFNGSN
jgi:lipopolysaccharide/colanic/teichoic acid biosynthesis glycosyltransferase